MSPYSVPLLGRLAWIDVVLLGWFALAASRSPISPGTSSAIRRRTTVIKWAWVLTSLYMGPIAAHPLRPGG